MPIRQSSTEKAHLTDTSVSPSPPRMRPSASAPTLASASALTGGPVPTSAGSSSAVMSRRSKAIPPRISAAASVVSDAPLITVSTPNTTASIIQAEKEKQRKFSGTMKRRPRVTESPSTATSVSSSTLDEGDEEDPLPTPVPRSVSSTTSHSTSSSRSHRSHRRRSKRDGSGTPETRSTIATADRLRKRVSGKRLSDTPTSITNETEREKLASFRMKYGEPKRRDSPGTQSGSHHAHSHAHASSSSQVTTAVLPPVGITVMTKSKSADELGRRSRMRSSSSAAKDTPVPGLRKKVPIGGAVSRIRSMSRSETAPTFSSAVTSAAVAASQSRMGSGRRSRRTTGRSPTKKKVSSSAQDPSSPADMTSEYESNGLGDVVETAIAEGKAASKIGSQHRRPEGSRAFKTRDESATMARHSSSGDRGRRSTVSKHGESPTKKHRSESTESNGSRSSAASASASLASTVSVSASASVTGGRRPGHRRGPSKVTSDLYTSSDSDTTSSTRTRKFHAGRSVAADSQGSPVSDALLDIDTPIALGMGVDDGDYPGSDQSGTGTVVAPPLGSLVMQDSSIGPGRPSVNTVSTDSVGSETDDFEVVAPPPHDLRGRRSTRRRDSSSSSQKRSLSPANILFTNPEMDSVVVEPMTGVLTDYVEQSVDTGEYRVSKRLSYTSASHKGSLDSTVSGGPLPPPVPLDSVAAAAASIERGRSEASLMKDGSSGGRARSKSRQRRGFRPRDESSSMSPSRADDDLPSAAVGGGLPLLAMSRSNDPPGAMRRRRDRRPLKPQKRTCSESPTRLGRNQRRNRAISAAAERHASASPSYGNRRTSSSRIIGGGGMRSGIARDGAAASSLSGYPSADAAAGAVDFPGSTQVRPRYSEDEVKKQEKRTRADFILATVKEKECPSIRSWIIRRKLCAWPWEKDVPVPLATTQLLQESGSCGDCDLSDETMTPVRELFGIRNRKSFVRNTSELAMSLRRDYLRSSRSQSGAMDSRSEEVEPTEETLYGFVSASPSPLSSVPPGSPLDLSASAMTVVAPGIGPSGLSGTAPASLTPSAARSVASSLTALSGAGKPSHSLGQPPTLGPAEADLRSASGGSTRRVLSEEELFDLEEQVIDSVKRWKVALKYGKLRVRLYDSIARIQRVFARGLREACEEYTNECSALANDPRVGDDVQVDMEEKLRIAQDGVELASLNKLADMHERLSDYLNGVNDRLKARVYRDGLIPVARRFDETKKSLQDSIQRTVRLRQYCHRLTKPLFLKSADKFVAKLKSRIIKRRTGNPDEVDEYLVAEVPAKMRRFTTDLERLLALQTMDKYLKNMKICNQLRYAYYEELVCQRLSKKLPGVLRKTVRCLRKHRSSVLKLADYLDDHTYLGNNQADESITDLDVTVSAEAELLLFEGEISDSGIITGRSRRSSSARPTRTRSRGRDEVGMSGGGGSSSFCRRIPLPLPNLETIGHSGSEMSDPDEDYDDDMHSDMDDDNDEEEEEEEEVVPTYDGDMLPTSEDGMPADLEFLDEWQTVRAPKLWNDLDMTPEEIHTINEVLRNDHCFYTKVIDYAMQTLATAESSLSSARAGLMSAPPKKMLMKPQPSVGEIIGNIRLRNVFMNFLSVRSAQENLSFLEAVNCLRLTTDPVLSKYLALAIFEDFVRKDAPHCINISGHRRVQASEEIARLLVDMDLDQRRQRNRRDSLAMRQQELIRHSQAARFALASSTVDAARAFAVKARSRSRSRSHHMASASEIGGYVMRKGQHHRDSAKGKRKRRGKNDLRRDRHPASTRTDQRPAMFERVRSADAAGISGESAMATSSTVNRLIVPEKSSTTTAVRNGDSALMDDTDGRDFIERLVSGDTTGHRSLELQQGSSSSGSSSSHSRSTSMGTDDEEDFVIGDAPAAVAHDHHHVHGDADEDGSSSDDENDALGGLDEIVLGGPVDLRRMTSATSLGVGAGDRCGSPDILSVDSQMSAQEFIAGHVRSETDVCSIFDPCYQEVASWMSSAVIPDFTRSDLFEKYINDFLQMKQISVAPHPSSESESSDTEESTPVSRRKGSSMQWKARSLSSLFGRSKSKRGSGFTSSSAAITGGKSSTEMQSDETETHSSSTAAGTSSTPGRRPSSSRRKSRNILASFRTRSRSREKYTPKAVTKADIAISASMAQVPHSITSPKFMVDETPVIVPLSNSAARGGPVLASTPTGAGIPFRRRDSTNEGDSDRRARSRSRSRTRSPAHFSTKSTGIMMGDTPRSTSAISELAHRRGVSLATPALLMHSVSDSGGSGSSSMTTAEAVAATASRLVSSAAVSSSGEDIDEADGTIESLPPMSSGSFRKRKRHPSSLSLWKERERDAIEAKSTARDQRSNSKGHHTPSLSVSSTISGSSASSSKTTGAIGISGRGRSSTALGSSSGVSKRAGKKRDSASLMKSLPRKLSEPTKVEAVGRKGKSKKREMRSSTTAATTSAGSSGVSASSSRGRAVRRQDSRSALARASKKPRLPKYHKKTAV